MKQIKKNKKMKLSVLFTLFIVMCLIGCSGETKNAEYDKESKVESVSSQMVKENEKYTLKWDNMAKCILLESKETGEVWSDILYDAYLDGSTSARANSPISITYVDKVGLAWETAFSFDMEGKVRTGSEVTENGICVTYYFDQFEIAVPVEYELREDSLAVSINGEAIQESGEKYHLVSVTLTPYMASCTNSSENYLFVPSGSGALMYTNEAPDGTRKYSQEMYGTDAAKQILTNYAEEEALHLPVFGAKDGKSAMFGIIEQGAGAAYLEGQAGYARLGASNIGATFYFRGFDTFRHAYFATGNAVTTRVAEERSNQKVTVGYYPLEGEMADYNGMAATYRNYLQEEDLLADKDTDGAAYSITLLGGTTEQKSFVGVPYDTLTAMTDFEQALKIVKDLEESIGEAPVVRMYGYGDNGLAPGTAAGGSSYPKIFGSKKQQQVLEQYCKENDIPLVWDMNIIQFTGSGMGASYGSDAAKTAILKVAERYPITPLREFDEENPYRIIARDSIAKVMAKALEKADRYEHQGVSFASLGELSYGDYSDIKYAVKAGMEEDVAALLQEAGQDGRVVASAGANWYAACASDYVFDVATSHGDYNVLDEQIPFYQMIFHSYRPLYAEAINLAENSERNVMLAATGGMGIGFNLIAEYQSESNELASNKLYGMVYTDNQELLLETLKENDFVSYYDAVKDSPIEKYELLENGVSATYFENGNVLYANHKNETVTSPAGELKAYGFVLQGR